MRGAKLWTLWTIWTRVLNRSTPYCYISHYLYLLFLKVKINHYPQYPQNPETRMNRRMRRGSSILKPQSTNQPTTSTNICNKTLYSCKTMLYTVAVFNQSTNESTVYVRCNPHLPIHAHATAIAPRRRVHRRCAIPRHQSCCACSCADRS